MRLRRLLPVCVILLAAVGPARAALPAATLATVAATPAADARVPLDVQLTDTAGRSTTLGTAIGGRPTLLMLADFRCTQLCGSLLGIAAQALHNSGLVPNQDFSLVVAGFNPDATVSDGAALGDAEIGAYPELRTDAAILTGAPASLARIEKAVGFAAVRDAEADRYAHPADLYVLTADGRVSRVLNGLSLDPATLRLALVEAGEGRIGSLIDRLHVLCYGLDPLSGASTNLAQNMLRAGASLTLLTGAGLAGLALRARRSRRA